MKYLFGEDCEITQEELDEMARLVIQKKWHVVDQNTRVSSITVNRSDTDEVEYVSLMKSGLHLEDTIFNTGFCFQFPEPFGSQIVTRGLTL